MTTPKKVSPEVCDPEAQMTTLEGAIFSAPAPAKQAPKPWHDAQQRPAVQATARSAPSVPDVPPAVNGAAARPVHVTFFPNQSAQTLSTKEMTLEELRDLILKTSAGEKSKLDRPPSSGPGGMLVESWPLRQRGRRSRST